MVTVEQNEKHTIASVSAAGTMVKTKFHCDQPSSSLAH
jgi:hypothetical protein